MKRVRVRTTTIIPNIITALVVGLLLVITTATAIAMSPLSLRSVKQILPATPKHWVGDGFHVHPVFGSKAFTEEVSPFLMFDYATPQHFPPLSPGKSPLGVGRHPHRGFETITIAFQGEVEHADSMGNRDVIRPGDVQWMTAGRGIVHQEYHSTDFSATGGVFEMYQLWLNLPRKDKMTPPTYQPILNDDIPSVDIYDALANIASKDDGSNGVAVDREGCDLTDPVGKVRIIAGSYQGTKGPASTFSPVELWDVSIAKSVATVDFAFPAMFSCIIFVRRGKIDILGEDDKKSHVGPQAVALMERNSGGNIIRIRSGEPDTSLVIMGGLPLNEPIAARGPFVMNTWDEISQANRDYQLGNFGS